MKKILILLMALVISVSMAGCGSNSSANGDSASDEETATGQNNADDGKDAAEAEEPGDEKIDIDNLSFSDGGNEKYDFGLSAEDSFGMAGVLKKITYTDLSGKQDKIQDMTDAAAKAALPGSYSLFGDYEEIDEDIIDKQAYVIGIEDDDPEKSTIETGAYHNSKDNKYYQYTSYISENYYDYSKTGISGVLKTIKSAYGINVSQSKVEKAVKNTLKKTAETEDYYAFYEEKKIKKSGYTEKITFSVEGFVSEENEIGYYIYAERERCNN